MKKFIVHTRPLSGYPNPEGIPMVVEVEGEIVTGIEDPSVMWLPNHEYKFRIQKPKALYEMREVSKIIERIAPIYYSHSIYHTIEQARFAAEDMIKADSEFELRKYGKQIDVVAVLAKYKEIKEILL